MISLITTIATIFLSAITSYFVSQKNSKSDYSREIAHEILKEIFSRTFFPSLTKNENSNNKKEILDLLKSFSSDIENSTFFPYLVELFLACNEVISSYDDTKEGNDTKKGKKTTTDKFEEYYNGFLKMYDFTLQDFRTKSGIPVVYSTFFEKGLTKNFVVSLLTATFLFLFGYPLIILTLTNTIESNIFLPIGILLSLLSFCAFIFSVYIYYELWKFRRKVIRDNILEQSSSSK